MIIPFTKELIEEMVVCNNSKEMGIFISLLSNEYIKHHKITKEQFFDSLKTSLSTLEETEQDEKE